MKLSVIVPCFNECATIEQLLLSVHAVDIEKEIIVVDGGSTDGTVQILQKVPFIRLILAKTVGKGEAVKIGIDASLGDIVLIQDADLEYDPNDYHTLLQPIINNEADVVYGSRFLLKTNPKGKLSNYIANRILTSLSNLYSKLKLTDMETCYKVFRASVIKQIDIKESKFGLEPELTAKVAKMECRIIEVPISYNPRTKKEGKKIGLSDGIAAIKCIRKYNRRMKTRG